MYFGYLTKYQKKIKKNNFSLKTQRVITFWFIVYKAMLNSIDDRLSSACAKAGCTFVSRYSICPNVCNA